MVALVLTGYDVLKWPHRMTDNHKEEILKMVLSDRQREQIEFCVKVGIGERSTYSFVLHGS